MCMLHVCVRVRLADQQRRAYQALRDRALERRHGQSESGPFVGGQRGVVAQPFAQRGDGRSGQRHLHGRILSHVRFQQVRQHRPHLKRVRREGGARSLTVHLAIRCQQLDGLRRKLLACEAQQVLQGDVVLDQERDGHLPHGGMPSSKWIGLGLCCWAGPLDLIGRRFACSGAAGASPEHHPRAHRQPVRSHLAAAAGSARSAMISAALPAAMEKRRVGG